MSRRSGDRKQHGSPENTIEAARLTHAQIEGHGGKFKRQGLGTAAVRFFLDCTSLPLELPEDEGREQSDGSHLTEDGVRFVASLRRRFKEVLYQPSGPEGPEE